MKRNIKSLIVTALFSFMGALPIKAETISIYDDTFSVILNGSPITTGTLTGRWGIWDSSTQTFNQVLFTAANKGYLDMTAPELAIEVNQINNNNFPATSLPGTPGLLALAIYTDGSPDAQALNFSTSYNYAILTDSSWTTPSFNNNATYVNRVFSLNTTAVGGSGFNYNGGNEVITLVPEPSIASLMMLGAAGLVALRRFRKV